ncbi:MAG: hypothetical protein LBP19_10425 [Treponema sp.]|nr:hypothetical protein [Treponema sp.]
MKNAGIVCAWIAGLLLCIWLLFFFTQSVQNDALIRAVNKTLAHTEDERRLDKEILGRTSLGNWYRFTSTSGGFEGKALLFSIIDNGILISCLAFVPETGEVAGKIEILPLSNHARAVFNAIHQGVINIYRMRIEKERLL